MAVAEKLRSDIDEILPGVIADRRHLHEHPELGFQEVETAKFVTQRLRSLGVEDIQTGINKTGITGLIKGSAKGKGSEKVVLLRADMDALPILEENEVEYVSQNPGVMHACGHDAHTSILLGVARMLVERKAEFAGTVKVLFQPAEEMFPGGANGMIQEGVLENPHVDAVFGLHMAQDSPLGSVLVGSGPIMAAADSFQVTIKGKGGHGAYPQHCIDPVVIGAQLIVALQTLVSREVNPMDAAVVIVCAFNSGEAFNVIPDIAKLGGTVRTFNPEVRDLLERRIVEIANAIGSAAGATVDAVYNRGYPATVNEPEHTAIVHEAAVEVVGDDKVVNMDPVMGAEDFSYFLEHRPGSYFFVGSKNEEKGLIWGHHHPKFDIDEESLGIGIETTVRTVLKYLDT